MEKEDPLKSLPICLGTLDLHTYGVKDILLKPIPSLRIKIKLECIRNKKEVTLIYNNKIMNI